MKLLLIHYSHNQECHIGLSEPNRLPSAAQVEEQWESLSPEIMGHEPGALLELLAWASYEIPATYDIDLMLTALSVIMEEIEASIDKWDEIQVAWNLLLAQHKEFLA